MLQVRLMVALLAHRNAAVKANPAIGADTHIGCATVAPIGTHIDALRNRVPLHMRHLDTNDIASIQQQHHPCETAVG